MSFTTKDVVDFLTTYRGINKPHDAVRAAWADLTVDYTGWLNNAPKNVQDAVGAFLGANLTLDAPKPHLRAPFGNIALHQMHTDDNDDWFTDGTVVLSVGDRLFRTTFYQGEEGPSFDGSELVEVEVVKQVRLCHLADPDMEPVTGASDPKFTPGANHGNDPEYTAQAGNIIRAILDCADGNEAARAAHYAYVDLALRHEMIEDAEGAKIRPVNEDPGPTFEDERKVVVTYKRGVYVLNFQWDSYGGVPNNAVSACRSSMLDRVETISVVPSGMPEVLVEMEDFFDADSNPAED